MAEKLGWSSYGDKQYVAHVLRYYPFGRIPTGTGSQAIVQVALSQEGNGGETYWSWYGFDSRVEWCACFASWCADQCGYIESGVIPKFAKCDVGVNWFQNNGQFHDGSYTPAAGDFIFFDWENDGSIDQWESWKVRWMALCIPLKEIVVMQSTGEVIVSEVQRYMGMVFRHIKKSRRKIVRAKEQCYNRKGGQADVLPVKI